VHDSRSGFNYDAECIMLCLYRDALWSKPLEQIVDVHDVPKIGLF